MNKLRDTIEYRVTKECGNCLFVYRDKDVSRDNCLRFARFVDHALHEASRGCDYWTPIPNRA